MKNLSVKYIIVVALIICCLGGSNTFGQTVKITSANSTSTNGITSGSITRGQTNVVLFGFNVAVASGTVNFTAFTLNGGTGGLFTNGRLYKTPAHGSTFASATIVAGATVSIVNNNPQIQSINESINNTDYTYFVVADLIPSYGSLPATVQYSFSQANWSYSASFSGVSFSCINPTVSFAPNTNGVNASSSLYYGQTSVVLMGVDISSNGAATTTSAFLHFSTTTANPFLYFPAATIEIWRSTSGSFATASKVAATINQAPNTITADLGSNVTINAGTTLTYYLVANFTGSTTGLPASFTVDFIKLFSNNGGTTYTNASGTTSKTYNLTSGSATFTNNNFTSSGITGGNISYGQTGIVLFSFGVTMQANATISSMYIPCTTNMGQYLNNTTAKLYRSTTASFADATVVSGASFNYNSGVSGVPITGLGEVFTAASAATYYYFVAADLNATASFPTPLTFNFSLSSGQSTAALTATNGSTYNSGSTITGQSFSIVTTYDWVGTYGSSWTDKRNFNPFNSGAAVTTLPDATITVLVGVNKAFTTAPIIPGTTIGGLSIKNATVTITGGTVTVVKNLNISGTTSTITGANDLAVGGDLINTSGSTLQLTGTGAVSIGGITTNSGIISKSSTGNTTFTGIVTNAATATINQDATSGTMTFGAATGQGNLGTINQTSGGSIAFSGALDNSGSIVQSGTATGTLDVTGALTNSGIITKSGTGAFTFTAGATNSSAGIITNGNATGSINFNNGLDNFGALKPTTGSITVNGIFTNNATGVVTIGPGALTLNATTPSNAGTITSDGLLDINGSTSFTNSGTINITGGTATIASPIFNNTSAGIFTSTTAVAFDGATDQAINNNNTSTPISFYDLVLSGGAFTKTLGGTGKFKIASTGSIEFTTTNTILAAGTAILTLSSDSSGSSTVKSLLAGNSITGTVNVERYLTGGTSSSRGYRLLSSPVSVSSSSLILPNLSYIKNSAYISGTGGPTNGFDVSGNPTLYFYRENLKPSSVNFTAGNFRGVSKINTGSSFTIDNDPGTFNLPAGNGFLFFFRGNRATNASTSITAIADPVTLTSTGYLNQGDVTVNHWTGAAANGKLLYTNTSGNNLVRGYNLVGNPYASSIDWDKVNSKHVGNIGSIIYIYNPKLKVYATYIAGLGGVGINFTGPQANIIPTGQGFFVIAQNQNATITFSEDDKVPSQLTASDLSLASAADSLNVPRYLRVQLFKDSLNKEEALVFFKNNARTNYNAGEDAQYLKGNSIVNLSTRSSDNVSLAINQQAFPQKRQIIPLNVNITSTGTYKLGMPDVKNIPNMYDVWLLDNYKKDSLDVKHNPSYSFIASVTDTNSFGSKRFSLVLRPNPALTVHLLSFTGTKTATQVKLAWKAENESSYTRYILERSIDGGKKFTTLDSLTSASLGVYNDLDPNPVKGQNLYRLKQIDLTGNISYSSIVPVMYADNVVNNITANLISVYPNPATSMLNLAITPATTTAASTAANYKITITNTTGSVIKSSTSSSPTWQGDVSILSPGTYFIQVTNTASNTVTGKSTFIKL